MYNGVGVRTARGTGTNGYVQKNFAALPASKQKTHYERQKELAAKTKPLSQLGPDREILEHDRKRQIESKLMAWADEQGLLDSDKPQEEIDAIMAKQREKIAEEFERMMHNQKEREFRKHESTHRILEAKARQHAELGSALGVSGDYREGQAFDRELQEQRRQQRLEERLEQEKRRRAEEKEREKRLHEREEERHREQQARVQARLAEIGGGRRYNDDEDVRRREKRKRSPSRSRSRSNSRGRTRVRSRSRSRSPISKRVPPALSSKVAEDRAPSSSPPRRRLSKSPSGSPPRRRHDSRSPSKSPSPPRARKASRSLSASKSRSQSRSSSPSGSSDENSRGRKRVKRE